MFQRQNDSKGLHSQSVWVAVNKEVPSQSLRAKSEDQSGPYADIAMGGFLFPVDGP